MTEETIESIKGFGLDWKCRGFQFEIGKTYEHEGAVTVCNSGFHAISGHPLEVFDYYSPADSRYALVTQGGAFARDGHDSKVASAKITIGIELHLHDLIQRAVQWVFDRAKPTEGAQTTGAPGAASSTGAQGAASSTGDYGAASSTGARGRAMGGAGNALFLVFRDPDDGEILHAWAGIVGRDGIKSLTWYTLNCDGLPVECAP